METALAEDRSCRTHQNLRLSGHSVVRKTTGLDEYQRPSSNLTCLSDNVNFLKGDGDQLKYNPDLENQCGKLLVEYLIISKTKAWIPVSSLTSYG
ncbi:hypothetical protein DDB_G0287049 [Dictyostelium discoideum AX4]|uniref:Uncharacterized protein n=1 Tax=Dictyostelium discoideum TaxID=44689 RepID=Q54KX7_DICDI|nr:hypothetical protein DDB_G0287049 [Dictyostelium discoideum AX4]EAL63889.1 hypothetical protein DDB_G0287049 [Dictyostelium discoideum AX4]|eukprot:XP_637393.1 hypothetical protein DDB_G0287049 [Dictyostelium discoideum AX4]